VQQDWLNPGPCQPRPGAAPPHTCVGRPPQGYSWDVRDEYIRHFLHGDFVTGQGYEARLDKTLLPRISKADAEERALRFRPECRRAALRGGMRCDRAPARVGVVRCPAPLRLPPGITGGAAASRVTG
jgi:hypothetical protein